MNVELSVLSYIAFDIDLTVTTKCYPKENIDSLQIQLPRSIQSTHVASTDSTEHNIPNPHVLRAALDVNVS